MTAGEALSDEVLVEAYLETGRRDDAIFSELFRRRHADVWRICFAFFGNAQDAEDMTQEVFFTVYRKLAQFKGQSSLRTWLHRITSNTCKNELRRRSRRPQGSRAELAEDDLRLVSRATAEERLAEGRRRDRLARAMEALSSEQRGLLRLVEFEGHPYSRIAADLGLSISAVKMRVLRARTALKTAYQGLDVKGESR